MSKFSDRSNEDLLREFEVESGCQMPVAVADQNARREAVLARMAKPKCALGVYCAAHETENVKLRKALEEALDLAHEGWSYASPYFRDKWQCEKREAELRASLLPSEVKP